MTAREEAIIRLMQMNKQIRDLAETMDSAAKIAKENDASGISFACLMLKDALLAYCRAVNDYAADALDT